MHGVQVVDCCKEYVVGLEHAIGAIDVDRHELPAGHTRHPILPCVDE